MSSKEVTGKEASGALAIMIISYAWSAYVLVRLWAWFVVPLGVPEIATGHACGLTVLIAFVSGRMYSDNSDAKLGKLLSFAIVVPLFALVLGYLSHVWMMLS